jgi:NTE family protein
MMESDQRPRVVIACQGGGSHTAFTAGVLGRLFTDDVLSRYRIVGLSGTSGGAICALIAWSSLTSGQPTKARQLLGEFWANNAATTPVEQLLNTWMLWSSQLANFLAAPAVSPYDNPAADFALDHLRGLLNKSIDFSAFDAVADDPGAPKLLLGAVDVMSGEFKTFNSREREITAEAVLASAAIPTLFRSIHAAGGVYWDGLFSQNPPVRQLLDTEPDEIWVIQINAQQTSVEPRTMVEIADRRNELSGNLSLYQELHFIEKIDSMLESGQVVGTEYHPISIRIIEMSRSVESQKLGEASKINRDPAFLRTLIEQGEAKADIFVDALNFERAWHAGDPAEIAAYFAADCEISTKAPFTPRESRRGADAVRDFVTEALGHTVVVDLTRKQMSGDQVRWRVRTPSSDPDHAATGGYRVGQAVATFDKGKITRFSLGPRP